MKSGRWLVIYILAGLFIAVGSMSGLHSDSVSNGGQAADLAHMQPLDLLFAGVHDDAGAQHRGIHCHSIAGCLVAMLPDSQQLSTAFRPEAVTISVQSATLAIAAPLTRPPII